MSNREAAAAITAEREALIKELMSAMDPIAKESYRWPYWPGTWTFADACVRVLELRARLSAPVAAQPAASGVDAAWVEGGIGLADAIAVAFKRRWTGPSPLEMAAQDDEYFKLRNELRAHLSTALTGAAKEVK